MLTIVKFLPTIQFRLSTFRSGSEVIMYFGCLSALIGEGSFSQVFYGHYQIPLLCSSPDWGGQLIPGVLWTLPGTSLVFQPSLGGQLLPGVLWTLPGTSLVFQP